MKHTHFAPLLITVAGLMSGCASQQVPTIAHTHIGHALEGWHDTPGQEGLFVTAENEAKAALDAAKDARTPGRSLSQIKADLSVVKAATAPADTAANTPAKYGIKNSLTMAASHIGYASESGDVTDNVKKSADEFSGKVIAVLQRCDLITTLVDDVMGSDSQEVAELMAAEIFKLAEANVQGVDIDGNGIIGNLNQEYGLKQLRKDLEVMIAEESPVYQPPERWFLFNLIRLPSGEWMFRRMRKGTGGGSYGGG